MTVIIKTQLFEQMNCQPPTGIDTRARHRITDKTETTARTAWCEGRAALPATGPVMPASGWLSPTHQVHRLGRSKT